MIKSYILKVGDNIRKQGDVSYESLFGKLDEVGIVKAVIITDNDALYFEKGKVSVMVCVNKENVGAAKIFARKIAKEVKKVDLSSLEEAFKFAEELDRMDLDGIAKFLR